MQHTQIKKGARDAVSNWSTYGVHIVLPTVYSWQTSTVRKNAWPRGQRLSERQMRIRTILKIMSKKYSRRQRREGVHCMVYHDTAGLYDNMN